MLFRESLVGPLQLNSSPDCGASGVKSKSTYGLSGVMQNGQPKLTGRRTIIHLPMPSGPFAGSATWASGE